MYELSTVAILFVLSLIQGIIFVVPFFETPCDTRLVVSLSLSLSMMMILFFFLLLVVTVTSASSSPRPTTATLHSPTAPPGQLFCVDTKRTATPAILECSHDPMGVRRKYDRSYIYDDLDLGVPQRIDGTAAERAGIKKVLKQMDDYIYREVLAHPAYRDVRPLW